MPHDFGLCPRSDRHDRGGHNFGYSWKLWLPGKCIPDRWITLHPPAIEVNLYEGIDRDNVGTRMKQILDDYRNPFDGDRW